MKIKVTLVLLFLAFGLLYAADVLDNFDGYSSGNSIVIEWKSNNETGLSHYELERSSSSQAFKMVHSETAKGYATSYKYIDEDAYSRTGGNSTQSQTTFTYRLKIVSNDNSYVYSTTKIITQPVSIIHRTWGMIKEMFR